MTEFEGKLRPIVSGKKMPCFDGCIYDNQCQVKYRDGTCTNVIFDFLESSLPGTQDKITITSEEIEISTSEPSVKVVLWGGCLIVRR